MLAALSHCSDDAEGEVDQRGPALFAPDGLAGTGSGRSSLGGGGPGRRGRVAKSGSGAAGAGAAGSSSAGAGKGGAKQQSKLGGDVWSPPGPIIATPAERALLRSYFDHTNRYLAFVDEASFWSALEDAKYYHEHDSAEEDEGSGDSDGDGEGEGGGDTDGAGDDGGDEADPSSGRARRSGGGGRGRPTTHDGAGAGNSAAPLVPAPGIAALIPAINAAAMQGASAGAASASAASAGASSSSSSSSSSAMLSAPGFAEGVKQGLFNPVAVAAGVVAAEAVGDEEAAASAAARAHARALQRHSNAYGFRVLFHVLLSMACARQLPCKPWLSRHHYELARAYLGPCFAQPSTHLVSALLCLVPMTKALLRDAQKAALHASLALRMAEICDVGPELRCVAESINGAHAGPEKSECSVAVPAVAAAVVAHRLALAWMVVAPFNLNS